MKVAIQGQDGSFHQVAAKQFFGECEIVPCKTFEQAIDTAAGSKADYAVMGIENSLYGSINETYELLQSRKPYVIGEVYLEVAFVLAVKPGVKATDITDIFSQAFALVECRNYLKKNFPKADIHAWGDTAAAAEHVAGLEPGAAAICSKEAAKLNGLDILETNVEDVPHNYTRFVIISFESKEVEGANKTSIILDAEHKPGGLYQALKIFNDHNINIDKIESRPVAGPSSWRYIFYLDFELGMHETDARDAVAELNRQGNHVTLLGSYVMGELPS